MVRILLLRLRFELVPEYLPQTDAAEGEKDGEELQGVARLGSFDGGEQGAAQDEVGSHGWPQSRAVAESPKTQDQEEQVYAGVDIAEARLGAVQPILPPAQVDGEVFDARAEKHVGEAAEGHEDVHEDGALGGALIGEGLEASVEAGGDLLVRWGIGVVFGEELGGLGALGLGVEGPVGKVGEVDGTVGGVPVDFAGAGEVEAPGLDPMLPAEMWVFAGVGGVARGEWFEEVEG